MSRLQLLKVGTKKMYSITVKTTNSETEYGISISSTKRLHDFLCAMDFQLVTKLEVKYFREVKNPHDLSLGASNTDTGSNSIVSLVSQGPDSWAVETPPRNKLQTLLGTE